MLEEFSPVLPGKSIYMEDCRERKDSSMEKYVCGWLVGDSTEGVK
jgi:hypothetical protein